MLKLEDYLHSLNDLAPSRKERRDSIVVGWILILSFYHFFLGGNTCSSLWGGIAKHAAKNKIVEKNNNCSCS